MTDSELLENVIKLAEQTNSEWVSLKHIRAANEKLGFPLKNYIFDHTERYASILLSLIAEQRVALRRQGEKGRYLFHVTGRTL